MFLWVCAKHVYTFSMMFNYNYFFMDDYICTNNWLQPAGQGRLSFSDYTNKIVYCGCGLCCCWLCWLRAGYVSAALHCVL